MSILFIISSFQETSTAFNVAARMARRGHDVLFLFIRGGCRHVTDLELVSSISFSRGVYFLEQDSTPEDTRFRVVEGVKQVDYSGWVELLELCDRVVSWS